MFVQSFSSGYYSSDFKLEEYNGKKAVIERSRFYRTGAMTERVEPLMMKVGKTRLPVYPSATVPHDVMAIPKEEIENLEEEIPSEKSVLIPKDQEESRTLF